MDSTPPLCEWCKAQGVQRHSTGALCNKSRGMRSAVCDHHRERLQGPMHTWESWEAEEQADESPPSNPGEIIINAVIMAGALDRAEHPTPSSTIFIWQANAAEQIEAALQAAGWKLISI